MDMCEEGGGRKSKRRLEGVESLSSHSWQPARGEDHGAIHSKKKDSRKKGGYTGHRKQDAWVKGKITKE